MDKLGGTDNINNKERQETLKKIKEYILSLIMKKQSKKKEIEKVLEETPKTKEPPREEKSLWEKIKEKLSFEHEKSDKPHQSKMESSPEDQDEYIPQDSEFGESIGEADRFGEIYPPFLGYYNVGKKSYFDPNTNLWSKKKQLNELDNKANKGDKKYSYAGIIKSGITAIPMPDGAIPDTESLCFDGKYPPSFQIDQNNCIYLISKSEQRIAFDFVLNQVKNNKEPIIQDQENIIFKSLSDGTESLIEELKKNKIDLTSAEKIKQYIIRTKKYSTKVQGTLRDKSNSKNYLQHIDESPILECFSANTLFVGLCRSLGLYARLVVGHMVQNVSKSGKAFIGSNTGHARSEVWDEVTKRRIRFDATPTQKDEEEKKKDQENKEEHNQQDQDAESNFDDDEKKQDGEGQDSKDGKDNKSNDGKKESDSEQNDDGKPSYENKEQKGDVDDNKQKQKSHRQEKSASQMLDELIEKAKEDNLTQNAEKIKETLDEIEKAGNKNDVKKALDKAGLDKFAKELIEKVGNDRILEEEKDEMKNLDDEKIIEQKLAESLLDEDYKEKLKQYAKVLKDKIDEQKKRMKSEMEKFGFKEKELSLYKIYKQLEKEVEPEVRKQIQEMKKILPPNRYILKDEENIYRSGVSIDGSRLADYEVTGDPTIFKRNREVRESNQINMFETIIIDRSGSMGEFAKEGSIFRESIKAAIIRSKVLEYFKVDFSIIIFDDSIDEVMDFGEKFSSKTKCTIPSKLMRACTSRSGGNSQEPISFVYTKMMKKMKELGGKSFGNISFIGDGDLYNFQEMPTLKAMIQDLKKRGFGITAYYINRDKNKMPLISYYFGDEENGGAIYAPDSGELSKKIIESHRKHLKNIIAKYVQ